MADRIYNAEGQVLDVGGGGGITYDGEFDYEGKAIALPHLGYKSLGMLDWAVQGWALFGDYLFTFYGADYRIFRRSTLAKLKVGTLTNVGTTAVHSNMISFGTEYYGGGAFPLLYSTHWDGDKGVIAYSFDSSFEATQVQVIKPSSALKANPTFGLGNTDFIVDAENGFLYSVCYKNNSWADGADNLTAICKFNLPTIADGSVVELNATDIIESFYVENIPTRQDACIRGGILYVSNGFDSPYYKATLRAIDLSAKKVLSRIDISKIVNGEPEGVEVEKDHLLISFVSKRNLYGLYFK